MKSLIVYDDGDMLVVLMSLIIYFCETKFNTMIAGFPVWL